MSNHRNRIKSLQPQPLYKHFNSDGHSLDDLTIQPIEEVVLEPGDEMSLHSKRLSRENFWMRELKTIQPYGLNDNVRSVGNITKLPEEPVVWSFFHRCSRVRKHKPRRQHRSHNPTRHDPLQWLLQQVGNYKSRRFLKIYTSSLFSCKTSFIKSLMSIVNDLIPLNDVPQHLLLIAREIAWFRRGEFTQVEEEAPNKHFLKVTFQDRNDQL